MSGRVGKNRIFRYEIKYGFQESEPHTPPKEMRAPHHAYLRNRGGGSWPGEVTVEHYNLDSPVEFSFFPHCKRYQCYSLKISRIKTQGEKLSQYIITVRAPILNARLALRKRTLLIGQHTKPVVGEGDRKHSVSIDWSWNCVKIIWGDRGKNLGIKVPETLLWEAGKERAGSRTPKVAGTGRNWENFATLRNIFNRKSTKRWLSTKEGAGTWGKRCGKRKVQIPLSTPHRLEL